VVSKTIVKNIKVMETRDEIIEYIYDLNLQNVTEKLSFDRAYKQGIEDAVDDLIELNLLTIPIGKLYCDRVNNPDNNRCIKCGTKAGHDCKLKTK
jgi:hypothetical protein